MDVEAAIDSLVRRVGASRSEVLGVGVLAALAGVFVLVLWWWQRPTVPTAEVVPPAAASQLAAAQLVVHVTGEVRTPGLVTAPMGARVADVIAAAGGASGLADLGALNLARPVVDGEQVVVPARRPVAERGTTSSATASARDADGRLDLNLATADQLQELPGVGPVLAQRIVDWREQHGPFSSTGQLRSVAGIGEKKFQSLAPLVTV